MVAALLSNPTIRKGGIVLGAVVITGVGYGILRRQLKKAREEKNRNEAIKQYGVNTPEGKAIGYATLLEQSMQGWGTNEKLMFDTIKKAKTDGIVFADLANAYNKLYAKDLLKRLQSELRAKELVEFQNMI